MAAGDVKQAWAAASNLTVTNLASLAASATWVAGWESAVIDNTSNKYLDYLVTCSLTTASANRQAGEVRVYVVAMLDDTTYFDAFDGTESTETLTGTVIRDGVCKLGAVMVCTNANAEVLGCTFAVAPLFGGKVPPKFTLFITGTAATSTNAQLAASGNQVTIRGYYETVAAS